MNPHKQAAEWIRSADGLLITAGAGMGVDSGLPDFRGNEGFWRAYPVLKGEFSFVEIANPALFTFDPKLAWGFYGHRLALYRNTIPHQGFSILQHIAEQMPQGAFIFTSNVDGQFQKAGFSSGTIVECHGSIHHFQCSEVCSYHLWRADEWTPEVDMASLQLQNKLPSCPSCGAIARPNILMFNDWGWVNERYAAQKARLEQWLEKVQNPVIIEIGAGRAMPTVRNLSEQVNGALIRINPTDSDLGTAVTGSGFSETGLLALQKIVTEL